MRNFHALADLLQALQEPTRLRLLWGLRHGELAVGEIVQVTGLSQPRVSRHLKLLCDARVLRRTPDQNEVYYRTTVDDDRRALVEAVLSNVPEDDPVIVRDRERLTAILDSRQARARALLDRLGVRPLSVGEMSDVSAAVDALLFQGRPPSASGDSLGDMLDVGTGTGSMLRLLANCAQRTVAVDLSRDMRLVARAAVLAAGLSNCTVRQGDMYDLDFPRETFDLVTMDRVLGTAEHPARVLGEAARVIRNGGRLLVVETSGELVDEANLVSYLSAAGLSPAGSQGTAHGTARVALAVKDGADSHA